MSKIKGKRVLVTGAHGFIGSYLIEALVNEGAKVTTFDLYRSWESWSPLKDARGIEKKYETLFGDVRDPYLCLNLVENKEIIFHLAALMSVPYSYVAPRSFFETNILGTVNLLEAARRSNNLERFVLTSTSETYGSAIYSPMDENHPIQAQSPYAASKAGADRAAMSYYLSFGTPVTILRPFNNFGPRQSAKAIIPTIISQLLSDKVKKVKLGSLSPMRDYTYAADTAEAFIEVATSQKTIGEILNSGAGKGVSIKEVYDLACDIIGVKKEVITDETRIRPQKSEVWKLVCDNKKIKKLVGWSPKTTFKKGLEKTISWIKENQEYYRPEIYNI